LKFDLLKQLLSNTIDIDADDLLEVKKVNRELILRRKLKPVVRDSDFIIIDTPPPMRAATLNAVSLWRWMWWSS
jgi:cellulose biosynthesis protein BcsQ